MGNCSPPPGRWPGAIETREHAAVRNPADSPAHPRLWWTRSTSRRKSELGHKEPEVVLAGDEVGRRRHVDHDVDVGGVDAGVDEGGLPGSERQIPVVEAAVGPAPLVPPAELVVQPPLVDAEVLDDPLGLEGPAVRANGTEVLEDLLVGDPVLRQVRTDADQGDRNLGSQPWDRGIGHRATSQSSEIGAPAGRGSSPHPTPGAPGPTGANGSIRFTDAPPRELGPLPLSAPLFEREYCQRGLIEGDQILWVDGSGRGDEATWRARCGVSLLRDAHHASARVRASDPGSLDHAIGVLLRPRPLHVLFERLPKIPSVRQKLAKTPLSLGRPFWIDDPDLDMDRHIHRVVLEAPGDEQSLADVVGDIASWPLRRNRPLWEIWVIEGLADGRVAVLVKMHHSTIDGVSGASMMGHLLDLEPLLPPPLPRWGPGAWRPRRAHSSCSVAASYPGWANLSTSLASCRPPRFRLATTLWSLGRHQEGATSSAIPFTAPRTLFNATITARRSVAFTDVALADIKMVKDAFGVTVNDVVTAVVGGALRHYLYDRGELPDRSLLAAAPVSVHDQTAERGGMTKVSVMFSTLATDEQDPAERLRAIASANTRAKEIHKMVGADTLMRWAEHFWLNAFALGLACTRPCMSPITIASCTTSSCRTSRVRRSPSIWRAPAWWVCTRSGPSPTGRGST